MNRKLNSFEFLLIIRRGRPLNHLRAGLTRFYSIEVVIVNLKGLVRQGLHLDS